MPQLKRYPGPRPFVYEDHEVFFGRNKEKDFLTTLILNNKTTVLQSKSGYGKSSLINAGIIPKILSTSNAEIIKIRFYHHDKSRALTPKDTLLKALEIQQISPGSYLGDILPENYHSAWSLLKKLHVDTIKVESVEEPGLMALQNPELTYAGNAQNGDSDVYTKELIIQSQDPEDANKCSIDKVYILVFDQFEELFTYPAEQVREFGRELFDVLQNRIPEAIQQMILTECQSVQESHKDEILILNKDLPVKMVFSIRADRFNYLTYLKDYLPNFLNNTYKLRRMLLSQVEEAIVEPARLEGNYQCPPFTIEKNLLHKIIGFLSYTKESERKVEIFEMQIICSRLEEIAIQYATAQTLNNTTLATPFELTENIILEYGTIKDKENFLSEFIQNYYKDTINSIEEAGEKLAARYLIENKLIDAISKNRISLDFVFVQQIGICQKTLASLVDKKIIRIETNSVNGKSFEISHDSLVLPILVAAGHIGSLEQAIHAHVTTILNKLQNPQLKNAVLQLSEAGHVGKGAAENRDQQLYNKLLNCELLTVVDYSPSDQQKDNRLVLKDAFRPALQQIAKKAHQHSFNALAKKYSVAFISALVVIAALILTAIYLLRLSNRYQGLVYIGYNVDSIKNTYHALALTTYLYEKEWNDEAANIQIRKKMTDLLHTPDMQARLGVYNTLLSSTQPAPEDVDLSYDGRYIVINEKNSDGLVEKVRVKGDNNAPVPDFSNASFAYFINNAHSIFIAYADTTQGTSLGDSFVVYDLKTNSVLATASLGPGRTLNYPTGYGSLPVMEYDSRRARRTLAGNLIVPFNEAYYDGTMSKLGIWSASKEIQVFDTDLSTSLSKDRSKMIIGQFRTVPKPVLEIRDQHGNLQDTIQHAYFGDFTPMGSVVFIRAGEVFLRKYNSNGRIQTEQSFPVSNPIGYAYVNHDETMAIAESDDSAFVLDLLKNEIIYRVPRSLVLGFNLDSNTLYTIGVTREVEDKIKTTLTKRNLVGSVKKQYLLNEAVTSFQFNEARGAILIQTRDNMLHLFDHELELRTSLKITANDLFQFSRNGDVFYYLLNNRLCIFEKKNIVNPSNFEAGYAWLKKQLPSSAQMDTIRANYHLKL